MQRSGVQFGQWSVAEQEPLLADVELHLRDGLVPRTLDGQDGAVAEACVVDLVAHADGHDFLLRLYPVLGDGGRNVGIEACRRAGPGAAGRAGTPEGPP